MKVARNYTFDDVRVDDMPIPKIGPHDALAKVIVCGVCTGEAMPWYVNRKCPTVLGHEPVVKIIDVGSKVTKYRRGDRVFVHHHTSCNRCIDCLRGHPTLCHEFKKTRLDPGGFSEYIRIPRLNLNKDTIKLSHSISDEDAVLIEPLGCSIHAFKRLDIFNNDTVLIIGAGLMGILNLQVARIYGARKVIMCEIRKERCSRAFLYGADASFYPSINRVRHETKGRGADVVIVCPPSMRALAFGLSAAAPGATVQLFAPMPPTAKVNPDFHTLYFHEQSIKTSYSCDSQDTKEAVNILSKRKIVTKGIVTHRFGLDGVAEALRRTQKCRGFLKAVIYPGGVPTLKFVR